MLEQTAAEVKADVVLISEPYKNPGACVWARGGRAAAWVTGFNGQRSLDDGKVEGNDFVAVRVGNYVIVSVYFSPSLKTAQFAAEIRTLTKFIGEQKREGKQIVVGGIGTLALQHGGRRNKICEEWCC